MREDLAALDEVRALLGPWWKWIATDVAPGTPGNRERFAYLFDSRKVRFTGISGEVTIPAVARKVKGRKVEYEPSRQLFRTPHLCGFKCGHFRLTPCQVHIAYGEGKADDPLREAEIKLLAEELARRAGQEQGLNNHVVLLGDFNIFSPQDVTLQALVRAGFAVPEALQGLPSNAARNRHYDQIAFLARGAAVRIGKAGVFDYYESVFREEDEKVYTRAMGAAYLKTSKGKPRDARSKRLYYKTYWRTYQMSDHLPMWVEVGLG